MLSVIIPCYNYGHLIAETIESIINQTYTNWEIIVIDDGSTDNTEQIINDFIKRDSRIKYRKKENAGPSAARNLGISISNGSYIQFLDADDLVQRRKFEAHISKFESDPDLDIVYGNIRYITKNYSNDRKITSTFWGSDREWTRDISGWGKDILPEALKGNFAHLSTTIYTRRIVDKVGKFDESKRAAEDYHFLIRCIIKNAKILFNDDAETYGLIRWHGDNTSKDSIWILDGEKKVHQELIPVLKSIGDKKAIENNEYAIKGIEMINSKSWKRIFLSGGKLDSLKKVIFYLGLGRIAKKIFFR